MKGRVGGDGTSSRRRRSDGSGRVRVCARAEDVHDFAFAVSPRFEVRRETVAPKGLPKVEVVLFLQPDHRRSRERYLRAAREGLALYRDVARRPTPTRSSRSSTRPRAPARRRWSTRRSSPAGRGGSLPPRAGEPGRGHAPRARATSGFHGMLASDEVSEAHLDEGLASWLSARAETRLFGAPSAVVEAFGVPIPLRSLKRPLPEGESQDALDQAASSRSDPALRETWRSLDDGGGPGERLLAHGAPPRVGRADDRATALFAAVKEYVRRFAFRHPTTSDFLDVVGEVAGPAARELLERGWASAGTVDYAVTRADVAPPPRRSPASRRGAPARLARPGAEPGAGVGVDRRRPAARGGRLARRGRDARSRAGTTSRAGGTAAASGSAGAPRGPGSSRPSSTRAARASST